MVRIHITPLFYKFLTPTDVTSTVRKPINGEISGSNLTVRILMSVKF